MDDDGERKAMKYKWECPKCGAVPDKHGKGGSDKCEDRLSRHRRDCVGFVCECDGDMEDTHGESNHDPCRNAHCYHCTWSGTFPPTAIDPKKLKGWKKTAWEAGWRPMNP